MKCLGFKSFILIILVFSTASYANCLKPAFAPIEKNIIALEDAMDECKSLNTIIPLIKAYQDGYLFDDALEHIEIALEEAYTPDEKAEILLLEAKLHINNYDLCRAHNVKTKLLPLANHENYLNQLDLLLLTENQNKVLDSKALNCMLAKTRSFGSSSSRAIRRKMSINLPIQFETNKHHLTVNGEKQVKEMGRSLSKMDLSSVMVNIIGHTDSRGAAQYNQELSMLRAQTVLKQIILQFPQLNHHLAAFGEGETNLKAKGNSSQDHTMNRRVEINLAPKSSL